MFANWRSQPLHPCPVDSGSRLPPAVPHCPGGLRSMVKLCFELAETTACERTRVQSEKMSPAYRCPRSVRHCRNNNERCFSGMCVLGFFCFLPDGLTCAPTVKWHGADLAGFHATLAPGFSLSQWLAQAFSGVYMSFSKFSLIYS